MLYMALVEDAFDNQLIIDQLSWWDKTFLIFRFIFAENKHKFNKYGHGSIDSVGVPYDYESIMHYGKRDFARWPWQTTIRPKKAGVSFGGQRSRHLSPFDVKEITVQM